MNKDEMRREPITVDGLVHRLERTPIIAAVDASGWKTALRTDVEVLFHLHADIMTIAADVAAAKAAGKCVLVHLDLADGIGKDKAGIRWLADCGVDGIISTRSQLIRAARECGLVAVQRFFVLDSKGMQSISEVIENTRPSLIEIMPGVIPKALRLFAGHRTPVIAGGLIETKEEVTAALSCGAVAVSTSKQALWSVI